jgi:hypothetical protein
MRDMEACGFIGTALRKWASSREVANRLRFRNWLRGPRGTYWVEWLNVAIPVLFRSSSVHLCRGRMRWL